MTETTKKSLRKSLTTETKVVTLSDGETKVTLEVKKMTAGDQMALGEKFPRMADETHLDAIKAGMAMLFSFIKSWDYEEEITEENFNLLPSEDITLLLQAINVSKKKA